MKKMLSVFGVMIAVIAAFFIASTLGGCVTRTVVLSTTTTTSSSTSTTSTTTTTIPETTTTFNKENFYINYVRDNIAISERFSDVQLLDFANITCESFRNGLTRVQVVQNLIIAGSNNGFSNSEISQLARISGAAIASFCPEFG